MTIDRGVSVNRMKQLKQNRLQYKEIYVGMFLPGFYDSSINVKIANILYFEICSCVVDRVK